MNELGIPLGMFLMVLGFVLFVLSIGRMLFTRGYAARSWKASLIMSCVAFIFFVSGILFLREGAGEGMGSIGIGMALILSGFLLIVLGIWQSLFGVIKLWGAFTITNSTTGLKMFMIGVLLLIGGVIIIALPEPEFHSRAIRGPDIDWYWLQEVFSKDIGGMPFGMLLIIVKLAINIIGLNKGLGLGQMLSINVLSLLALILVYHMYPLSMYAY